jgi:hypothetical protein
MGQAHRAAIGRTDPSHRCPTGGYRSARRHPSPFAFARHPVRSERADSWRRQPAPPPFQQHCPLRRLGRRRIQSRPPRDLESLLADWLQARRARRAPGCAGLRQQAMRKKVSPNLPPVYSVQFEGRLLRPRYRSKCEESNCVTVHGIIGFLAGSRKGRHSASAGRRGRVALALGTSAGGLRSAASSYR